jgi:hypothetical protein
MKVKDKREKDASQMNSEFLSNYFNCVLEGIFMPFPSRTFFCAERIQTNFKLGSTTACVGNVQTKHGANVGVSGTCQRLGKRSETRDTGCSHLLRRKDRPTEIWCLIIKATKASFFNRDSGAYTLLRLYI